MDMCRVSLGSWQYTDINLRGKGVGGGGVTQTLVL